MDKEIVRKPRSVLIDPDAIHRARLRALHARKTLGEWMEEAVEEKAAREEREEAEQK